MEQSALAFGLAVVGTVLGVLAVGPTIIEEEELARRRRFDATPVGDMLIVRRIAEQGNCAGVTCAECPLSRRWHRGTLRHVAERWLKARGVSIE